jgi:hypothetical protein
MSAEAALVITLVVGLVGNVRLIPEAELFFTYKPCLDDSCTVVGTGTDNDCRAVPPPH